MFLVKSSSIIYTIRSRSLAKCYSCTVSYNIPSNPIRQIVLLSILPMRKLRPRCGILTEVTEPGLPDVGMHVFNHCAIKVVLTVLGLVKLKVFLRDERGMWPPGACLSQKQLGVGWEMSLLWHRVKDKMGQKAIIIVSLFGNMWGGSGAIKVSKVT